MRADIRQRYVRYLLACGSGLLTTLCVPDTNLWWLGFFAFIPWIAAIANATRKQAFLAGLLTGSVSTFIGFFWLTQMLSRFSGLSLPASIAVHLLFSLYHGLQWALPSLLVAQQAAVDSSSWYRRAWMLPLAWYAVELALPNLFPTYMALMWSSQPILLQHADLVGAAGVSASIVACNALLYLAFESHRRRVPTKWRATAIAIAFVALLVGYGKYQLTHWGETLAAADKVKIGVVQGNFGILTQTQPQLYPRLLADLQRESAKLEHEGATLILWGETAYPFPYVLRTDAVSDFPENSPLRIRRGFTAPIVFGAVVDEPPGGSDFPFNSAYLLDEDGRLAARYNKNYPLYFGEAAPPLIDPTWYTEHIPGASHIQSGDGPGLLLAGDLRLGPLICYEDLLPHFVRNTVAQGVHVLVNLTNDSWFGNTREPAEHLGLALLRTIENRRPMLRSVNAGVSAHIDARGVVIQSLPVTDSDVDGYVGPQSFVANVAIVDPSQQTFFNRSGGIQVALFVLLQLAFLGYFGFSRRQAPHAADTTA